ncbi:MAG: hypothetical protein ABIQ27_03300 [Flavobacterium sp.]|uniref:hypothetical protein n=1 Tax=Flavobacterium sp. TaxID=239 RepID=UPI003267F358
MKRFKEVDLEKWSREDLRKKINSLGNWVYHPIELDDLNSFDEIQALFNGLGLDFMIPVRSKWAYNCSGGEFIEKVNSLKLNLENKSPLEQWAILQAINHANVVQAILNGSSIAIVG